MIARVVQEVSKDVVIVVLSRIVAGDPARVMFRADAAGCSARLNIQIPAVNVKIGNTLTQ